MYIVYIICVYVLIKPPLVGMAGVMSIIRNILSLAPSNLELIVFNYIRHNNV